VRDLIADRYFLLNLGAPEPGGTSYIRKAVDREDGSHVAVKFVKHNDDRITRIVFDREVRGLRSLSHPNIVKLRDAGQEDEIFYLVLDWVDESLHDILTRHGPYEWGELADKVAMPLASALSHAHLMQVEHRDIKPRNVLVTKSGVPLLADFGIAKIRSTLDSSGETVHDMHSAPYSPPELDEGIAWVRDVYSMGVLLIQAMHPERLRHVRDIQSALDSISVPPDIRRLLSLCVDLDPAVRPSNGSVLAQELETALNRDRGRVSARRNVAWMELTRAAQIHLAEEDGSSENLSEAAKLLGELEGSYIDFGVSRSDGKSVDRGTLIIAGNNRKLVIKPVSSTGCLKVVSAHPESFEGLERIRRRSVPIEKLVSWTFTRPRDDASSLAALDVLNEAIDEFRDAQRAAADREDDTDSDLFENWLRVLEAREELARGARRPLAYSSYRRRDRELTFALVEEPDNDVLGEQFDVIGPSGRQLARGEVVRYREGEMTLRLSRYKVPSLPSPGNLAPFLGASQIAIQRQMDAVRSVMDGASARPDLRTLIARPESASAPAPVELDSWNRDLDASKREAVQAALGARDVVLVQGPPGAGKTDFIAEIVAQFLTSRPAGRVLIVSQTHVAVDNALSRLDKARIGGLVRLGIHDDPRVDASVKHLLLDQRMDKWATEIRRKAEAHLDRRAKAAGISTTHLRAALSLKQYIRACEEFSTLNARVEATDDKSASDMATGLGVVEDRTTVQTRMDRLIEQQAELLDEARGYLASDLTVDSVMSADQAVATVEAIVGADGAGEDLLELLELQAEWLQRVTSDRNMADVFLKTSRVIAGTCLGFISHPAVRDLDIDLCILDEASKATATEALVPLARAQRSILVGDTNQLPPSDEDLLRARAIMDEYGLDEDSIRETLFQRLADRLPDHSKFMLSEQYRMIRPIGDLISTCFYEGKLRSPKTNGLRGYEILGKPVLWINTERLGDRRREDAPTGLGTSYANREEARVVVERIKALIGAAEKGILSYHDDARKLELLLIAPYRRQVEELTRRVAGLANRNFQISVHSVDAVQGRECDIAIFSVTRSNTEGRMGFLGKDYWRRINVALSRARYGLVIVGDLGFCRQAPGALREVSEYMVQHSEDCEIRDAELA
jgi:serine/threonine protein kinase